MQTRLLPVQSEKAAPQLAPIICRPIRFLSDCALVRYATCSQLLCARNEKSRVQRCALETSNPVSERAEKSCTAASVHYSETNQNCEFQRSTHYNWSGSTDASGSTILLCPSAGWPLASLTLSERLATFDNFLSQNSSPAQTTQRRIVPPLAPAPSRPITAGDTTVLKMLIGLVGS